MPYLRKHTRGARHNDRCDARYSFGAVVQARDGRRSRASAQAPGSCRASPGRRLKSARNSTVYRIHLPSWHAPSSALPAMPSSRNARRSCEAASFSSWRLPRQPLFPTIELLRLRENELNREVERLSEALDPASVATEVASKLAFVNETLTDWARELELEHSEHHVQLDVANLTIVANTRERGAVPLRRIRRRSKQVGYHIVAHLALHKWFVEEDHRVSAAWFSTSRSRLTIQMTYLNTFAIPPSYSRRATSFVCVRCMASYSASSVN